MDSAELIGDGFNEDPCTEPLDSSCFLVNQCIFRDPEVSPRVGDEYQIEIPPFTPAFDYIPTNSKSFEVLNISYDSRDKIGSMNSEKIIENSEKSVVKNEVVNQEMNNGVSIGKPWNEDEEAVFLLGVYIFGKNFDQVKRFIESKKMGEILTFYYGWFYMSSKYHKWKKKCERRMYGAKIFSGLRQKELLSRLLPLSSEDCHHSILEVSKKFIEGNTTLEDYISTLKSQVGTKNLIEAVGIGKRNQDLTRIIRESMRSSHSVPTRSELPIGKACSSLTLDEIVKFLTGDFRLSKTRSSDLFWEAVWPRLLSRGWHSEQPMDRNSLVFLMPGVKKFSRRKLIKGDHYFDCITDVLSKVGSEPQLLEIEIEMDQNLSVSKENEKLEKDISQMPKSGSDFAKITVIDTSLAREGNFKVRETKYVEVNTLNIITRRSNLEEFDSENSNDGTHKPDPIKSSCFNQDEANGSKHARIMFDEELYDDRDGSSRDFMMNGSYPIDFPEKTDDKKPRKHKKKSELSQREKLDNSIYLAPNSKKQRRLSSCSLNDTNHGLNGFLSSQNLKNEETHDCLHNPDSMNTIFPPIVQAPENLSSNDAENHHEKTKSTMLFDLNKVVPLDTETNRHFTTELMAKQEDHKNTHEAGPSSTEQNLNMNSRRQSTRNRPLTTKALEALANGYLSVKQRRKRGDDFEYENLVPRPSRRARGNAVEKNVEICDTGLEESKVGPEKNESGFQESKMGPENDEPGFQESNLKTESDEFCVGNNEFKVQSEEKEPQISAI